MEFVFWEERLPECLVRFGTPLCPDQFTLADKSNWAVALTNGLRSAQQQLAADSIARDAAKFTPILHGRSGAGGTYDFMRRVKSLVRREKFRPEHGEKFQ